jgi:transposase
MVEIMDTKLSHTVGGTILISQRGVSIMKNTMKRKRYDADFKKNAVELVLGGHRACRSVERDLGLAQGMLGRWIQEYQRSPQSSFPGNGRKHSLQNATVDLEREISVLRTERDILKKALAIFSTTQGKLTR